MIVYQNNFENGFGSNAIVEGNAVIKSVDSGHVAYFDGDGAGLRLMDSSFNLLPSAAKTGRTELALKQHFTGMESHINLLIIGVRGEQ